MAVKPPDQKQAAARRQGWPERVAVKIGPELAPLLETEARTMDMVPSRWIEGLLRRRLLGRPTLGRAEELAFIAVQVELRRIAVHVHHVLGQIEASPGRAEASDLAQLAAYATEIRGHLERLRAAFRGNLDYWDAARE